MQARKPKTAELAIGHWPRILSALGIDSRHLANRHGPCPACGGQDRFRFDDKEGRGTWYCTQCGAGDGFLLLQRVFGWNFSEAARQVDRVVGAIDMVPATPLRTERSEADKARILTETWQAGRPVVRDDPVWRYLNRMRHLDIDVVPADLRFHPALRYIDEDGRDIGRYPAMLALMRYPDGTVASIHRTYLNEIGEKAPVPEVKKIMPGKPLKTASVRLGTVGRHLGIAEGVETAMAASRRFGVPVWAATNAELMKGWVPPASVERVSIFGDNDASYTGQAAAFALAQRLVREGCAVEIHIPDQEGKDWADEGI